MPSSHLDQLSNDLPSRERQKLYLKISEYQKSSKKNGLEEAQNSKKTSSRQEIPPHAEYLRCPFFFRFGLMFLGALRSLPPEQILLHMRMRKLRKQLQSGPNPLLQRQGKKWLLTPFLAQRLYAIYNHLFTIPIEQENLGKITVTLAPIFLSPPTCQNLLCHITEFCPKEEIEQLIRQDGNPLSLWERTQEQIKKHFFPIRTGITRDFLLYHSYPFQIARMKIFPFGNFFALFSAVDLPGKGKPHFCPALLDDKSHKLLGLLFLLLEETGPLHAHPPQEESILSWGGGKKIPILGSLSEGMRMLEADWSKLLHSPQVWDLLRYVSNDFCLRTPLPQFRYQEFVAETRVTLTETYFSIMKKQFDALVEEEMQHYLNNIKQRYLPEQGNPLKFYHNRLQYQGYDQQQLSEAIFSTTKRNSFPLFYYQQSLELLRDYCSHWLDRQLVFLDRVVHTVLESPTLRNNGSKILDSANEIKKYIASLDNSLATKAPRGLRLKELRLRVIHGHAEALQELFALTEETNQEAEEVLKNCIQILVRLAGYVRKAVHTSFDALQKTDLVLPPEEKSSSTLERLQLMGSSIDDFLYLLKHRQQLDRLPREQ